MKILKTVLLVVLLFSFSSPLHSEEGIWLTAEEWTLMQNLWISSDSIYPHSMTTLESLSQSSEVTGSLLTDYDKIAETEDTLLTGLDENNDEATNISESLNTTSGSLETTTDQLGPSFWESTGGKIVLVLSGLLVGVGAGMIIGVTM